MTEEPTSIDAAIEEWLLLSTEQSELDAQAKEKKAGKDALAARIRPFIEETADDGQKYTVIRDGRELGSLNIQQSASYVLAEGVTYDDLVQNGLMERRKSSFLRFYPKKEKSAKSKAGDGLTDELV